MRRPAGAAAAHAIRRRYNRGMRILLATALLCLLAAPAHAWGPRGHRLVGHLAEARLTPAALAQVETLLRGVEDAEQRSLAGISTWADELREHDPDLGRRSARWHYVNIGESGCRFEPERDCPGGDCVIGAINAQAAILADRGRSDAERLQALKFVVHFVGDVHQPMHAGFARDRGGNTVQVNLRDGTRDGRGTNLHALWDSGMFHGLRESEPRHLAKLEELAVDVPSAGNPARWAEESCELALRDGVYPPRARVDQDYVDAWRPVAEERIVIAGHRLAELLNRTLTDGH